eukprot:6409413-Amphidinium_carterae.1
MGLWQSARYSYKYSYVSRCAGMLSFASRDPLASRLLNYELVFTDLTTASYARPILHKRSGWHNIIATTHEAHRG